MPTTGWRRLLVEPRRPASVRDSPHACWLVVLTVCIGAFMGQLDASVVALAFPTLAHDFGASLGDVQWVGLSYLLTLVAMVAAVGRLADMVGRKLLYVYGFLVFIVGSALCGLAPDLVTLDVFRAVQALGAAMLQANSVAIIATAMPATELGRGIGVQGAAQALGLSLGPAVGGLLIALGGWRLIFYVNVPVGLVGAVLGWYLIPRSRHLQERVGFDWVGLALFVPAVASLLLVVSYGHQLGWTSPAIAALAALAAASATGFLRREVRTGAPMIDLSLFARAAFSAGIASGLLAYLVLFGTLFVVPFYLETARGVSAGRTGLELSTLPAALALAAPLAGRVTDRAGPRLLTVGAMSLGAVMLVLLAFVRHGPIGLLVELAGLGAALGAFIPANNAAIMASAPREQSGVAGGVLNMTRGLGTALGLAVTGLVLGLVAGAHAGGGELVTRGFAASTLFLAGVCVLAAALSGARGPATVARRPAR